MELFTAEDIISWKSCTVTVGFFDGVHLGHQFLIKELIRQARSNNEKAVVITFDKHPKEILKKKSDIKNITTLSEKISLLERYGVDACLMLNFTKELSRLSAWEFIEKYLKQKLKATTWLLGYDHKIGHNRNDNFGNYQLYAQRLGVNAILIDEFKDKENHTVSSTQVRKAIREGNIQKANRMLNYPFSFFGEVTSGRKIGHTIEFPTANLEVEKNKIIPVEGVYAVTITYKKALLKGMMNIGTNPTISSTEQKSIEVHIFNFNENIYNQTLKIEVIERIRDEMKFDSIEMLKKQLIKDKEHILNHIFE